MKPFEYCVFIGRFQPFHHGHYDILTKALNQAEKVLIIIGSHKKAPDIENPWSSIQRQTMITSALTKDELERVQFLYVRDSWYMNNKWLTSVQQLVNDATNECDDSKICIIGAENDFPQWKFFQQKDIDNKPHATVIRNLYFTRDVGYKFNVHPNVVKLLEDFEKTETFKLLKGSFDYIREYKASWEGAPFAICFTTIDAIVIKSGHVLVVRRKGALGKGQLALPGGFLNINESTQTGAIRELKEETQIKLSKEVLEASIKDSKVFDYPKRSLRGRVISHAFLIDLGTGALPGIKAADDAEKCQWLSLSELAEREEEFFEDHFHIISHFCNRY